MVIFNTNCLGYLQLSLDFLPVSQQTTTGTLILKIFKPANNSGAADWPKPLGLNAKSSATADPNCYADKNVPNEKNLIMNDKDPFIFDPGNEPYFGRILLHRYNQAISVVLGQNDRIVPLTYAFVLNDAQQVAAQIIEPNPNQHGPFRSWQGWNRVSCCSFGIEPRDGGGSNEPRQRAQAVNRIRLIPAAGKPRSYPRNPLMPTRLQSNFL